jgi:hypothetical protein
MKTAGKYKYLYKMDTDIAYDWLRVWVDANCDDNRGDFVYHLVPWAFNTLGMVLGICTTYLLVIKNLKGFHDSLGI